MKKLITLFLIALPFLLQGQDKLLIPMDHTQTDHLKAYGIAYKVLERGIDVEWLLNYRGGSFMMDDYPEIEQLCELKGVRFERVSPAQQAQIYAEIEENNMNNVLLEKAPKVAVYIPPYAEPWDDAVALALEYAEIPYDRIYDEDILKGKLSEYD
ncbi:MAG TPA: asparagine synthetase B, partial [candidate division WOR-3 bacterium]|nr:asparagine synthetase B [candidate division WOR-3 bacterium]